MQHSDMNSSYYQYYQPHFQNPNPNPSAIGSGPQMGQVSSASYSSAPPAASNYGSSDYGNYSSSPYPSNPEPVPTTYASNPNLTPSSKPPHQQYSFPHLDSSYYPYDQNQTAAVSVNYDYSNANSNYNSSFNYSSANSHGSSSAAPNYEKSLGTNSNFGGYGGDVYKYNGGKVEAYGGRGGKSESGNGVLFDDYGRPINIPSGKEQNAGSGYAAPKIVKAAPKVEEQHDTKGTIQKFRVMLLSEGIGQSDTDVLCQIGLDGIRLLDPSISRTLKIYPLEAVTRWDVLDSYIFAFWTKTSVDAEPRRVRLKSNIYTTNNILDTVTAASIQVKEIGETNRPSDPNKGVEQPGEKKKGLIDWMSLMKPGTEEKDHWVPDEAVTKCTSCAGAFNAFNRKHHCRNCGDIFCDKCTQGRIALTADENAQPVRVCDRCMAEVTQRLSNTNEAAAKVAGFQSHEELVRRLKEVMDKNCKGSPGLTSNGPGKRTREVACPTCTVHLQVEVPASGSETIECSVCQHAFKVDAH